MLRAPVAAVALFLGLCNVSPSQVADPEKQPAKVLKDALGDPLPDGAILRLGSNRMYSGGGPGSTCAFSPDGKLLAWIGPNNHARLYRVEDGKTLLAIDRGAKTANAEGLPKAQPGGIVFPLIAVSPDGKYVASQSRNEGAIRIHEVATGKQTEQVNMPEPTSVLAFSADGKRLAAGTTQGTIFVLEVPSGKTLASLKGGADRVWAVRFTADGNHLWAAQDKNIVQWDVQKEKQLTTLKGHELYVFCLTLSADGKTLASGSQDNTIRVWDLSKGKDMQVLKGHEGGTGVRGVHHVSFVEGGKKILSVAGDRTVRVWDLAKGTNTVRMKTPDLPSMFFTVSADGTRAAQHRGQFLEVFDFTTRKVMPEVPGHRAQVRSVAWSADGKHIATAGFDDKVRVWDAKTGAEKHKFQSSPWPQGSVFFLPDNKTLLVSGCYDSEAHLWDITTGKKVKSIPRVPPELTFRNKFLFSGTLAVSKDGKLMASATAEEGPGAANLSVMSIETGKPVRTVVGLPGKGFGYGGSVAFTPDGKAVVISSHADGSLVEVATGNVLKHPLPSAQVVAVSPKGNLIAIRSGMGMLHGVDPKSGKDLYMAGSPASAGGTSIYGHALAFSPDGKYLATATTSTIFLRDPKTGNVVREINGHLDSVQALAFSPDSRKLVSASDDGTALVWDLRAK